MIDLRFEDGLATIALDHGPVNAIRLEMLTALDEALDRVEGDAGARALVLTGSGPFFSFGFDVPHFLDYARPEFERFLVAFTSFYTRLFAFPKPTVCAINGHAVAGGWMLAQACDARVCATGRVKLGLNEVRFGAALFSGSVEILRHLVGGRHVDRLAGSGPFLDPDEALAIGAVDELSDRAELAVRARAVAEERYGAVQAPAFAALRRLVRGPIVDGYRDREAASIERFLDVWYAPEMREALSKITIRK
jgi:enoyl-CoA hydratase